MILKMAAVKFLNLKPSMYSRSVVLNVLGMQFYRTLFFYLRRVLRAPKRIKPQFAQYLKTLERDGILVIPNFFPEDVYNEIKEEYRRLSLEFRRDDSEIPFPHVDRMSFHDKRVPDFLRQHFLNNPILKELPRSFLNRNYNLRLEAYLVKIYCNQDELALPKNGGTNNLHFDAPLRVLKGFYYLNDADERNGPLQYCLGSQKRNSLKRLLWEYKLSVRYAFNRWNPDHQGEYLDNEPWVKITEGEIKAHELKEKVVSVKRNTMVFVNVGGFHRRGEFLEPGVRETIEVNYRNAESPRNDLYFLEKKFRSLA